MPGLSEVGSSLVSLSIARKQCQMTFSFPFCFRIFIILIFALESGIYGSHEAVVQWTAAFMGRYRDRQSFGDRWAEILSSGVEQRC